LLHVEQFRYDVRAACSEFMSTGEVNKWRQRPHWLAAARPVDYGVSWYEVSPQFADFFRRVRGETVRVGDIACGYLSDAQKGDDAEDFRRFFTALQACVVCGIVSLAYD